jgi:hypothetical protein
MQFGQSPQHNDMTKTDAQRWNTGLHYVFIPPGEGICEERRSTWIDRHAREFEAGGNQTDI